MITTIHFNIGIKDPYYSSKKKYFEECVLSDLFENTPKLVKDYYHMYPNYFEQAEFMREHYHARIVKTEPRIIDVVDEWKFIISYDIEWDGLNEEEL